MRKRSNPKKHTVTANVQILDLTKAGSSIEFKIYANKKRIGTIVIGRGSMTWRGGKRQREETLSWSDFAKMMDDRAYGE